MTFPYGVANTTETLGATVDLTQAPVHFTPGYRPQLLLMTIHPGADKRDSEYAAEVIAAHPGHWVVVQDWNEERIYALTPDEALLLVGFVGCGALR